MAYTVQDIDSLELSNSDKAKLRNLVRMNIPDDKVQEVLLKIMSSDNEDMMRLSKEVGEIQLQKELVSDPIYKSAFIRKQISNEDYDGALQHQKDSSEFRKAELKLKNGEILYASMFK